MSLIRYLESIVEVLRKLALLSADGVRLSAYKLWSEVLLEVYVVRRT